MKENLFNRKSIAGGAVAAVLACCLVVLAGCGGDDDDGAVETNYKSWNFSFTGENAGPNGGELHLILPWSDTSDIDSIDVTVNKYSIQTVRNGDSLDIDMEWDDEKLAIDGASIGPTSVDGEYSWKVSTNDATTGSFSLYRAF
ncbi:hypothetical protein [Pontiella sp.]|uniref:hypothetical protein n=1 Tax=Pontiella sp. TaxID=2837462 RepID=UPI003561A4EC